MARPYQSNIAAVADAVTINNIDSNYPRNTVTISFFSDAAGTTPVLSGITGTMTVEGIATGGQTYTDFFNSPLDMSTEGPVASAASPLDTVRVTPTSIAGAAYYRVTLTGNRS